LAKIKIHRVEGNGKPTRMKAMDPTAFLTHICFGLFSPLLHFVDLLQTAILARRLTMAGFSLPLILGSLLVTQQTTIADLAFHSATLTGWEGKGFVAGRIGPKGDESYWVSSQDRAGHGHKALLHRAFVIPAGAAVIRFRAYAARARDRVADDKLDVTLLATGKRVIPKLVHTAAGWKTASGLLPPVEGQPQEYLWRVEEYVGQYVRIVLVDEDDRPGCHVVCSGFQILGGTDFEAREFSRFMVRLAEQHQLPPMMRYESPHFIALGNASETFSEMRLGNCELLYALFWDHFRQKGFALREPENKLMVAMFDSQAGFNAYLGHQASPLIVGMYHLTSNRFVVYDYGQNELHLFMKSQTERQAQQIHSYLDRQRFVDVQERRAHDFRAGTNISTVMHEVAHQLSFNCGMLNRRGDVPFWLAEGLACYCEATDNGSWQGIGEPNPLRLPILSKVLSSSGSFIQLRDLISRDDWMPSTRDNQTTLLAYAQSWALFRMLMEEQPHSVRAYLESIYPRRIRDRRLADFQQAFGHDLVGLQQRHEQYIAAMINQQTGLRR
jgi:hypothetical protein